MAAVTVKNLAEQIGISSERLLQQLEAAGISSKNAEGNLDDKEKETLLAYLRGGNASTDSDLQRRITLKRRTTSAVRQTSRTGGARTVHVEVKKRRTYVKRGDLQRQQQVAREAAEAEKAARLAAEEEAKAKVEAEKKAAEEAAAKAAEEEASGGGAADAETPSHDELTQDGEEEPKYWKKHHLSCCRCRSCRH